MIEIVSAQIDDIDTVLRIYETARAFMIKSGNPDQWKNSYPPYSCIAEDIKNGNLYLLKNNGIADAVFFFAKGPDAIYNEINGKWLNDRPYSVIHRVASAGRTKGVLKIITEWCLTRCDNIKIDTHFDNKVMQHCLAKLGYTCCGTVVIPEFGEMKAYQYDRYLDKT